MQAPPAWGMGLDPYLVKAQLCGGGAFHAKGAVDMLAALHRQQQAGFAYNGEDTVQKGFGSLLTGAGADAPAHHLAGGAAQHHQAAGSGLGGLQKNGHGLSGLAGDSFKFHMGSPRLLEFPLAV